MSLHLLNSYRAEYHEGQLEQIQIKVGENGEGFFKLQEGGLCKPAVLITSQETVGIMKKIIEFTTGISWKKQHIFHKGTELENTVKLLDTLEGEKTVFLTCDELAQKYFTMEVPKAATLADVAKMVKPLVDNGDKLEENYAELLPLCAQGLIALSQCENFTGASFGKFKGLENHLGKPKYGYVFDNQYPDTTKLRKAGPLYIIKGMESKSPVAIGAAYKAMETVVKFYLNEGHAGKHADDLLKAVLAMVKGYFDLAPHKKQAYNKIKELCQENCDILAILKNMPYFVFFETPEDFPTPPVEDVD